jgi:hypothetical protein
MATNTNDLPQTRRGLILMANVIALVALFAPATCPAAAATEAPAIRLTNYQGGETIRYPVALLVGKLSDRSITKVTLINSSSKRPTAKMDGQASDGVFKVLAELVPGENRLELRAGSDALAVVLRYEPPTSRYFVRAIYMTDSAGDTAYQTQREKNPQDFAAKFDTAMKLMQTLTAERMHDLGYGRHTFNLELDDNGKVIVHVVKGKRPAVEYYAMKDQAWYAQVNREMSAAFEMRYAKNVVIASYTRFDPETRKTRGHTALGGGDLGLFGSGNLFTWPSTLQDVQPAFSDTTKMDRSRVQDDSAGRGTFWGAASTTIGATLHEMGHAFGLPHTRVGWDVMTRGFDHFNRVFTTAEPGRRRSGRAGDDAFAPDEMAAFAPISAEALLTSRWFTPDRREYGQTNDVEIKLDPKDDSIVVRSETGIRFFSASAAGTAMFHRSPPMDGPAPKMMKIPLSDIRAAAGEKSEGLSVRATNADGHSKSVALDKVEKVP